MGRSSLPSLTAGDVFHGREGVGSRREGAKGHPLASVEPPTKNATPGSSGVTGFFVRSIRVENSRESRIFGGGCPAGRKVLSSVIFLLKKDPNGGELIKKRRLLVKLVDGG